MIVPRTCRPAPAGGGRPLRTAGSGAALAAALALVLAVGVARGEVVVTPAEVGIGISYHGARIRATAPVAEGGTAVFVVTGPRREVRLKVKGRVGGILWKSVGEVRFEDVPALHILAGAPRLPPVADLAAAGLTPAAMRDRVLPPDAGPRERDAFPEMLKLFEKQGVYGRQTAGGSVEGNTATVDIDLPPAAGEGRYSVRVWYFVDGRPQAGPEGAFTMRKTGLVETTSHLVRDRGFLYGLVAVVVALLAGLFTGWVFGRGRRK